MNHLAGDFEFNIHWKPFLLNPNMPDEGIPIVDYCRMKFGEEAAQRFLSGNSAVSQRGRELVSMSVPYSSTAGKYVSTILISHIEQPVTVLKSNKATKKSEIMYENI